MPQNTDLVTDLPADFEVFGQAVATSMADLLGGTTGQILAKNSATDMDFVWIANDQGDITAVTAGTGITGGGTSGAVTITNDMATTITAAGDIVVGTGSGTYDNLPIGTTAQVLTADTTVSPYKVKWATPASGSTFAGASIFSTAAQTLSNATETTLTYTSEKYDTDAYFTVGTSNTRFTVPAGKAGKYLITATTGFVNNATGQRYAQIYVNGTGVNLAQTPGVSASIDVYTYNSYVVSLAVSDYVELKAYQNSGGSLNVMGSAGGVTNSYQISYLGA